MIESSHIYQAAVTVWQRLGYWRWSMVWFSMVSGKNLTINIPFASSSHLVKLHPTYVRLVGMHPAILPASATACLSLYHLKFILNLATWDISKTPRFSHILTILKALPWLKINQCIQYQVLFHLQHCNHKNLHISTTYSTYKLTPLLTHLLLSLCNVLQ